MVRIPVAPPNFWASHLTPLSLNLLTHKVEMVTVFGRLLVLPLRMYFPFLPASFKGSVCLSLLDDHLFCSALAEGWVTLSPRGHSGDRIGDAHKAFNPVPGTQ